jgi:hypothetical protein
VIDDDSVGRCVDRTKNAINSRAVVAPGDARQTSNMSTSNVDTDVFGARTPLKELRVAHRDLDVAIEELTRNPHVDQVRIRRLKKQKLRLKDLITRLESELIPDLNA